MDSTDWIAVGSTVAGFAVGWGLGRWSGRADMRDEVTMRIDAMRRNGKLVADLNDGKVQWASVEALLRRFPGQEKVKR